jgi:hypothetical protein
MIPLLVLSPGARVKEAMRAAKASGRYVVMQPTSKCLAAGCQEAAAAEVLVDVGGFQAEIPLCVRHITFLRTDQGESE